MNIIKLFLCFFILLFVSSSFSFSDNQFVGRMQLTYSGKKALVIQYLDKGDKAEAVVCDITASTQVWVGMDGYTGIAVNHPIYFWNKENKKITKRIYFPTDNRREDHKATKMISIYTSDQLVDYAVCRYAVGPV